MRLEKGEVVHLTGKGGIHASNRLVTVLPRDLGFPPKEEPLTHTGDLSQARPKPFMGVAL
jgi:hypothetical protein